LSFGRSEVGRSYAGQIKKKPPKTTTAGQGKKAVWFNGIEKVYKTKEVCKRSRLANWTPLNGRKKSKNDGQLEMSAHCNVSRIVKPPSWLVRLI
jgi:hypothetical protein